MRMSLEEVQAAIADLESKGLVMRGDLTPEGEQLWKLTDLADEYHFRQELRARGFMLPVVTAAAAAPAEFFAHRAVLSEVA